ncbi:cobalamin B12-binding domain-containing protein [Pelosinus propionicus]|uniref:Methylmalonyl-CoA mutase, cobalamin-binding subunit n=1 Tax=Pelosinus propionicus DSM 13327 TaxID=1123291 RepID=A0A1I4LTV7_9FIRM|nr:methylmalonyl-CoA mutase [Pelosinus propionicus]SFL94369.1 Methylmalonyl-CoA mutase, cobalamin-binding subunit [Pelosinus propionicus DSM 13327]
MDIQIKRRFNEKELPDMQSVLGDAKKIASEFSIGETLFMKKHGVKSEAEYKRNMIKAGKLMKHSVIGWNSWSATEQGFKTVYKGLERAGSFIDRLGVALDWVMGVPKEYRNKFQAGGSLIFQTQEEWNALGQVVPVQPHLGDHMIGSLNSVENTVSGLRAGVTAIGNLAQYFTYEYPGLDLELYRTENYMKAIAIMAEFKDAGAVLHCNLDDGYGAQFHDVANLVGWAKLERYIAEELLGGRVAHTYGNLFSDSVLRIVFNRAMGMIDKYGTPGSFINGNTIDYGTDISRNYGALCSYSLADIICQMKYPSGYAIAPVPLTEAIRIPSAEEMIEAHCAVDMMMEKAPYYEKFINWEKINSEAEILVTGGNIFFERVINALDDLGIDINHAGQITGVLKAIGPEQLEVAFGVGAGDKNAMRGRVPIRPTSIIQTISKIQDDVISRQKFEETGPLTGMNVVVGSTDVHEFGKEIIKNVIKKAGANVFDLGTTVSIAEIADTLIETGSNVIALGTYNGMAYSFGKDLLISLKEANLEGIHVLMGGRLNEPVGGSDIPVDVSDMLREMGINADNNVDTIVDVIASYK